MPVHTRHRKPAADPRLSHALRDVQWLAVSAVLAALVTACGGGSPGAGAQPEQPSGVPQECDRGCLEEFVDQYFETLVAGDPSVLPVAEGLLFTENNQQLALGEGTWNTVTGLGRYRNVFADPAGGQVGAIAVVEENGQRVIYDLRLAIDGGRITEIETLIARDPNGAALYEEHGTPHPKFLETVPVSERLPRDVLTGIADQYLSGMQRNDPLGDYSFFHDLCDRWEHARPTTNQDPEEYGHSTDTVFVTLSCREQFETGFLGFVTRIRDRRYAIVDEERQTVFGFVMLDHDGTVRSIPLSSGEVFEVPPYFSTPRTLQVGEAWRIEDGRIRQIEMTLTELPYGARPLFDSGDDWLQRAAPAPGSAPASDEPCSRSCLRDALDAFTAALLAGDPSALPLAESVRYTENGQLLNPGDGLWGTLTQIDSDPVSVLDPASGTAALVGTIVEWDVPGQLFARLRMDRGRITEIEAVVVREESGGERGGTLTLFAPRLPPGFDPALAPAAGWGTAEAPRDRRVLAADEEQGLRLDIAFHDFPNERGSGAPNDSPPAYSGPFTVLVVQLHEVDGDRVEPVETAALPVPFRMPSGW